MVWIVQASAEGNMIHKKVVPKWLADLLSSTPSKMCGWSEPIIPLQSYTPFCWLDMSLQFWKGIKLKKASPKYSGLEIIPCLLRSNAFLRKVVDSVLQYVCCSSADFLNVSGTIYLIFILFIFLFFLFIFLV